MTPLQATQIAIEAGNKSMREAGRTEWAFDDYTVAQQAYAQAVYAVRVPRQVSIRPDRDGFQVIDPSGDNIAWFAQLGAACTHSADKLLATTIHLIDFPSTPQVEGDATPRYVNQDKA